MDLLLTVDLALLIDVNNKYGYICVISVCLASCHSEWWKFNVEHYAQTYYNCLFLGWVGGGGGGIIAILVVSIYIYHFILLSVSLDLALAEVVRLVEVKSCWFNFLSHFSTDQTRLENQASAWNLYLSWVSQSVSQTDRWYCVVAT